MNNLNIPNKNKQPKKIRPKTIKKQIENFLVTYHVLSKGLNQARITPKQTILIPILIDINQYKINQPFIFINFSSICHLQYPINNNQSDFHYPPQTKIILYLSIMGGKEIDEEIIIIKIFKKIKRTYLLLKKMQTCSFLVSQRWVSPS